MAKGEYTLYVVKNDDVVDTISFKDSNLLRGLAIAAYKNYQTHEMYVKGQIKGSDMIWWNSLQFYYNSICTKIDHVFRRIVDEQTLPNCIRIRNLLCVGDHDG